MPPHKALSRAPSARILVVEDDPYVAATFRAALERDRGVVRVAGSVAETRHVVAEGLPDLVLLDLGLPDGDGLDLIEPLARAEPVAPTVLVVSARGGEDIARALELGARDFVQKPVRMLELRARVDAALRDRHTLTRLDLTRRRARRVADRAARLQRVATALSGAIDPRDVAATILHEGRSALEAVAGGVAVLSDDGARLRSIARVGFAEGAVGPNESEVGAGLLPGPDSVRLGRPIFVGDPAQAVRRYPILAVERQAAVAAAPLVANGRSIGAISFRLPPGPIPRSTRGFLLALADLGAQALDRARLYELESTARARAEATSRRLGLLAASGALLADVGDHRALLQRLAALVAPAFADLCAIDGLDDAGRVAELLAVAGEPARAELFVEMRRRYPLHTSPEGTVRGAAAEGRGVLVHHSDEARRRWFASDDEHLRLLRRMGVVSLVSAPIAARGRAFGVLTLASTTPGRHFDEDDLALAEELARRCALAIESARLHEAAERELAARQAAEAALRRSEALFRALVENTHDVFAVVDADGVYRYVSPAVERMLGYSPDELVGRPGGDLVHPDDQPAVQDLFARLQAQPGQTQRAVLRTRCRDGGVRQLELVATNAFDVPEVGGMVLNGRDVTTRERHLRELAFQAKLLDSVQQAVAAADLDGAIIYWNRFAATLFGWSAAEALGRPLAELVTAERARADLAEAFRRARRGEGWSGELAARRRDGTTFPGVVQTSPIAADDGRPTGLICVALDLTERRRADADRLELGRTLALLDERERIAMELHDGTIQALYGTGLRLGALARTLPEESPVRRELGEAVDQVRQVIDDVRGYVAGLRPTGPAAAGLRAGLAAAVGEYRSLHPRVELRLPTAERAGDPPLDPQAATHVLQVVREAVSNAVRHADATAVRVRARWSRRRLVLEVRDDGVGLAAEQVSAATGQGLRNMANRARVLGGWLDVTSQPAGGTLVRLEIPLRARGDDA